MKTGEVLKFYKGVSGTAKALGISNSAVAAWSESPPRGMQFELQVISNGQLIADRNAPRTGRQPQKKPGQEALTTSAS